MASEQAIADALLKYYTAQTRATTGPNTLELANRALEVAQQQADAAGEAVEVLEDLEEIDVPELEKATDEAPVVRMVNVVLTRASRRAPATSTSSHRAQFRVRFRIDGVLYE